MSKIVYLKIFSPIIIFLLAGVIVYVVSHIVLDSSYTQSQSEVQKISIGSRAPDFTINDIYGSQMPFSFVYQKKLTLLIFWSTWCPHCAQELNDLLNFGNAYQDKAQIVLVISGEPKQTIEAYISDKNIPFLSSLDTDRAIWRLYGVQGTPSHFLVNTSGAIVADYQGTLSYAQLGSLITNIY